MCVCVCMHPPSSCRVQAVLREAEGGLVEFLAAIRPLYPDLHVVLTATSPDFAVAVLCAVGSWALRVQAK